MKNIILTGLAVVLLCGCSMFKKVVPSSVTRNVVFEEEDTQRLGSSSGGINTISAKNTRLLRRAANKLHARIRTEKKEISIDDLDNAPGYIHSHVST
jgi:hypothetical protein